MKDALRLLVVAALTSGLSQAALAEHPVGSPAWVRAQQAGGTAPADAPQSAPAIQDPVIQESGSGDGVAIESPAAGQEAAAADPAPEAVTINPLSRMPLSDLQAFKGRPLFSASRRPADLPASLGSILTEAPATESAAPDLRLVGIVAGVDRAVAVLSGPGGGPPISVRVGDTVEAWQVHLIAPDRVVLRQGEREQAYRIFASAGAAIRAPSQPVRGEASAVPTAPPLPPVPDSFLPPPVFDR